MVAVLAMTTSAAPAPLIQLQKGWWSIEMEKKGSYTKMIGHDHGNIWDDDWLEWKASEYTAELPPLPVDRVGNWTQIAFANDGCVTWLNEDNQETEWWRHDSL